MAWTPKDAAEALMFRPLNDAADPDEFVRRQESNEWPLTARKVVDIERTLF